MKAVRIHEFGDESVLRYEDIAIPEPAFEQVQRRLDPVMDVHLFKHGPIQAGETPKAVDEFLDPRRRQPRGTVVFAQGIQRRRQRALVTDFIDRSARTQGGHDVGGELR